MCKQSVKNVQKCAKSVGIKTHSLRLYTNHSPFWAQSPNSRRLFGYFVRVLHSQRQCYLLLIRSVRNDNQGQRYNTKNIITLRFRSCISFTYRMITSDRSTCPVRKSVIQKNYANRELLLSVFHKEQSWDQSYSRYIKIYVKLCR